MRWQVSNVQTKKVHLNFSTAIIRWNNTERSIQDLCKQPFVCALPTRYLHSLFFPFKSANLTWFGTKRSLVQIQSPRPPKSPLLRAFFVAFNYLSCHIKWQWIATNFSTLPTSLPTRVTYKRIKCDRLLHGANHNPQIGSILSCLHPHAPSA